MITRSCCRCCSRSGSGLLEGGGDAATKARDLADADGAEERRNGGRGEEKDSRRLCAAGRELCKDLVGGHSDAADESRFGANPPPESLLQGRRRGRAECRLASKEQRTLTLELVVVVRPAMMKRHGPQRLMMMMLPAERTRP